MKVRKPLRFLAAAVAVAIAAGAVAVVASAILTGASGGVIKFVGARENTDPNISTSNTFTDVPGAVIPITIGDGSDLLIARFAAESACL